MARILDLLPDLYRLQDSEDRTGQGALQGLLVAIDQALAASQAEVAAVAALGDVDTIPDAFLDYLLTNVANPFLVAGLAPARKRALARQAFALYRLKGTKAGIVRAIRAVLGIQTMVLDWWTDTAAQLSEDAPRYWTLGETCYGGLLPGAKPPARAGYFLGHTELDTPLFPHCRTALAPVGALAQASVVTMLSEAPAQPVEGDLVLEFSVQFRQALALVLVDYSLDGGYTWRGATIQEWGNDPLYVFDDAPATVAFEVTWDTLADQVATNQAHPGVQLRVTVLDGAMATPGQGAVLRWLRVNNTGEENPTLADVVELSTLPPIVADIAPRSWRLNVAKLGSQTALTGVDWKRDKRRRGVYHFEVILLEAAPLDAATLARVRDIADFMKPAHTHFHLVEIPTSEALATRWILGRSRLGDTTVLGILTDPWTPEEHTTDPIDQQLLYWVMTQSALGANTRLFGEA